MLPSAFDYSSSEKDFIHLFVRNEKEITSLTKWKDVITNSGMIWVSWQKMKTGQKGEASEALIRKVAIGLGLVDIKVCSVNESWSGLKLVWRKENR